MSAFESFLEKVGEFGIAQEIKHPIVTLSGLPHAKPNEIVLTESGQLGEVFSIERDSVKVMIFSKDPIRVGTRVTRTGSILSIPVGDELLGQVINPLGEAIYKAAGYRPPTFMREIDQEVKKINERARIVDPLNTGIAVIDLLVPMGKGQRELVLGDRKTGKTAFLNTIIKQQVKEGALVVYAMIGKKKGEIKRMVEYFEAEKILPRMIFIATDSQDASSSIFLTPFSAMTIAEYYRERGQDVLLLFDDLTTHAKFYREVSLLSNRFPGRDSYPGDIFFTHAKLLERAGNVKIGEKGSAAITCLPIVETIQGDLTGYIQTNLMGITDGHIYFDSNVFYNGRRPAINVGLSVTRVGKQTQSKLKKQISSQLTAFLASYEKMLSFSHFGAELSKEMIQNLKRGEKLYHFFDQHFDMVIPQEVQLTMLAMVWNGVFHESTKDEIVAYRKNLVAHSNDPKVGDMLKKITAVDKFEELIENVSKIQDDLFALCKTSKA
jgi:F-type H+-transporting ATPase subunit alpha